jgi:hypothetical protein
LEKVGCGAGKPLKRCACPTLHHVESFFLIKSVFFLEILDEFCEKKLIFLKILLDLPPNGRLRIYPVMKVARAFFKFLESAARKTGVFT